MTDLLISTRIPVLFRVFDAESVHVPAAAMGVPWPFLMYRKGPGGGSVNSAPYL